MEVEMGRRWAGWVYVGLCGRMTEGKMDLKKKKQGIDCSSDE